MAKVWNINTSLLGILAIQVLIGQVLAGSTIGMVAFAIITFIIYKTKHDENAHNG